MIYINTKSLILLVASIDVLMSRHFIKQMEGNMKQHTGKTTINNNTTDNVQHQERDTLSKKHRSCFKTRTHRKIDAEKLWLVQQWLVFKTVAMTTKSTTP